MSNMSYCRFTNTAQDLRDCAEHITDKLGADEARARITLANICIDILEQIGVGVDTGNHPDAKFYIEQSVIDQNEEVEE